MPKYTAKAYLVNKGKVVPENSTIELTAEQAKNLGDLVEPYKEKTVQELKEEAKGKNIEGYNDMKKEDLEKALGYTEADDETDNR